ncbi:MAG: tetratricopeptide repeat protein [Desulfovibrio sp.]|uniref:tetratricopeptide repeat protein n=1 Tax=Desulfovibrio sp. 7SRBS1 TaxID=3378064 RepID=UPI003B3CD517
MKRILGVFRSDKTERIGAGTTSKETSRQIAWFVIDDGTGQYVAQPLMENNLPSSILQTIPRSTFQSSYKVDALNYRRNIYPVLQSLRRKVSKTQGFISTDLFEEDEKTVYKALVAAGTYGSQGSASAKYKTVRYLLDNLEDTGEMLETYRQEIVRDSISLRKAGKLDMALDVYKRAYELNPQDDHLLFNMARVLQAKNEEDKAVRCLARALTINPGLVPARKMYKYLTGADFIPKPPRTAALSKSKKGHERRNEPRLELPGISMAAKFDKFMASTQLQNISCNGLLVQFSSQGVRPIETGKKFTLEGLPGKLANIFSAQEAEVVWLGENVLGGRFITPISQDTRSLAQILSLS